MHLLYPFAKRFIAGEDMPAAINSLKTLNAGGFLCTVDILGEHTTNAGQAKQAKAEYLALIREIKCDFRTMDFSIKLSQMGSDVSENLCRKNIEELLSAAKNYSARFDMEGSNSTQRTVSLCLDLHRAHKNLGIALQAYLFRTEKDVQAMIQNGISVRLCKGAYKENPDTAYQDMTDIRANFLKLAFPLLKQGVMPAIATHDEYLIKNIVKFVADEKIDTRSFHFELLYGVRRDLQKALLDKEYQVRIYVPYGKAWLPYTLRRLAERKENIIFVVKSLVRETLGLGKLH